MKKIKNKKTLIITIAVIVAAAAAIIFIPGRSNTGGININETVAERRDIISSIKGTATILPKDSYAITSLVSGDVLIADFEEGDFVAKEQLLYKIDSSDIEKNISSTDVALKQSQLNYREAVRNKNDLYIKADDSGTLKTVYVKRGDMVAAGTKVADIYDDRMLELTLPFNQSDIASIYVGAAATVRVNGSSETVHGTVASINNTSYVKLGNMLVQDVKINVTNPGTLSVSDSATAEVNGISCNDMGGFKYSVEKSITAKTTGEVSAINIEAGNFVRNGDTIITLKSDSLDTTIEAHGLSVENARISQSKAIDALDNYIINAPIEGTVVTKNIKAGDKLDVTNMSTPMAIIYDMSLLKLTLNVDELDINRIANGQEVNITADALEGKLYTGYVSNISINANVQNGITTYPVTIEIFEFDESLLPGMNVEVEMVVGRAANVLAVPANAVVRGNIVYVKGEKTEDNDDAPNGFKSAEVQTGAYSTDFIEIISGLAEGDVVYSNLSKGSLAENMQRMMSQGGPGQ